MIETVLQACISANGNGYLDHAIVALRGLESEAALDEAQEFQARAAAQSRRLPLPSRLVPPAQRDADGVVIDLEAFEAALIAV